MIWFYCCNCSLCSRCCQRCFLPKCSLQKTYRDKHNKLKQISFEQILGKKKLDEKIQIQSEETKSLLLFQAKQSDVRVVFFSLHLLPPHHHHYTLGLNCQHYRTRWTERGINFFFHAEFFFRFNCVLLFMDSSIPSTKFIKRIVVVWRSE